jgi:hypothetical protein
MAAPPVTDHYLDHSFVEQLSHIVHERLHDGSVLVILKRIIEKAIIDEKVEHIIDAILGLVREMLLDDEMNRLVTHLEHVHQIRPVVGEFDLVKAKRALDKHVKGLSKGVAQVQLFLGQLVVLEEQADLEYDLDYVVQNGLGLFLAVGVFFHELEETVECATGRVVDEYLGHALVGHFGGDLFLDAQRQRLRIHRCRLRAVVIFIVHVLRER